MVNNIGGEMAFFAKWDGGTSSTHISTLYHSVGHKGFNKNSNES
jgi:hypothetical protein